MYLLNMSVRYVASGGKTISTDLCMSRDDCPNTKPEAPKDRDTSTLP